MRMLGERACARLIERIADPGLPPIVELLPTELVHPAELRLPGRDRHPPASTTSLPRFRPLFRTFCRPAALE